MSKVLEGLNRRVSSRVYATAMAHRFKNVDRNTPMFLPPDLRDWVAPDDLVHFVIQAVDRLPLSTFAVNHKGCAMSPAFFSNLDQIEPGPVCPMADG